MPGADISSPPPGYVPSGWTSLRATRCVDDGLEVATAQPERAGPSRQSWCCLASTGWGGACGEATSPNPVLLLVIGAAGPLGLPRTGEVPSGNSPAPKRAHQPASADSRRQSFVRIQRQQNKTHVSVQRPGAPRELGGVSSPGPHERFRAAVAERSSFRSPGTGRPGGKGTITLQAWASTPAATTGEPAWTKGILTSPRRRSAASTCPSRGTPSRRRASSR